MGWCLRNRMIRNGVTNVRRVWSPAFTHGAPATATTLKSSDFAPVTVAGVRAATFKFYRKLGSGHVR